MGDSSQSTPANATDPVAAATALAGMRKAQADADSAEAAAASAKLKAAFGDGAAGPYAGAVNAGEGAALAEMNFLARQALQALAERIIARLEPLLAGRTGVLVAGAAPADSFAHADALQARLDLTREACERAKALCETAVAPPLALPSLATSDLLEFKTLGLGAGITTAIAGAVAPGPVAAAGAALMGVNAVLGFLRANFAVGGAAITVAERALIVAVAGELRRKQNNLAIALEGFPLPASAPAREALATAIDALVKRVGTLDAAAARVAAEIAATSAKAEPAPAKGHAKAHQPHAEPAEPAPSDADLDDRRRALAAAKRAGALFDALQTDLFADAGGAPMIERAAMEQTLRERLGGSPLRLSLALDGTWGTHISREGLLSGLRAKIPMQASATSAANWAAFDLAGGDLLGAGLETCRSPLTGLADVGS